MLGFLCSPTEAAVRIEGQVQAGGGPAANSAVTRWAASGDQPRQLAQTRTNDGGCFEISSQETPGPDISLYVVAKGGEAAANKSGRDNPAIELLSVLGNLGQVLLARYRRRSVVWLPHSMNCRHRP